ncbi:NrdH-redoxin [Candidatus Nomurabacteria bacterium]|nr:NrdH-redoxin [Candidatus Nomurabacteria bacterium]
MKKVTVYSTPTCTYCKMTKDFFATNNVSYEDIDVSTNEEKRNEMVEKSGQMGVPVLDIEGQIIVGFDEPKIREALGL